MRADVNYQCTSPKNKIFQWLEKMHQYQYYKQRMVENYPVKATGGLSLVMAHHTKDSIN